MGSSGSGTGTPISAGSVPGTNTYAPVEYPLLPLETFRHLLGWNPFHFWGIAGTVGKSVVTSKCNTVVKQYAWQDADIVGRAEIAEAILTAEKRLKEYLGYSIAPHYVDEELQYPRYFDSRFWRGNSVDAAGRWLALRAGEQYVQDCGVETLTSIGTANVTLSDEDGDGLDDTFTASIATSVTDEDEIAVYFNSTDRLDDETVGERWRIKPLRIKITGGVVYIRGRAWQLVKPLNYEGADTDDVYPLDPTAAGVFASSVDIYRRYTSGAGQLTTNAMAVFTWETPPWPNVGCCTSGTLAYTDDADTDPAAIATIIARVGLRDARKGLLAPGTAAYDSTSGVWKSVDWGVQRPPDRVTLRYRAGYPLENGEVARKFQTVVARLAMAELARPICACESANRELARWQFDLSRTGANDEVYSVPPERLNNPFGTRRGHVYAWHEVAKLKQVRGVAV